MLSLFSPRSRVRLAWSLVACLSSGEAALAQGHKLNGLLPRPIGGDIRSSGLSRDGAHLVFVADQDVDERFDLFAVDARAANPVPVRLNIPSDFADVQDRFVITPDGSRVVYLADQETNNVFELFVVPLDGSAAPRKLNGIPVMNGDVTDRFQVSPNGKRVLYIASQDAANRRELFIAPLDGSAPAVKLNGPIPPSSGIVSFSIGSDSRLALFLAPEQTSQGPVNVLYGVPLDGQSAPVRLLGRASDGYVFSANGKSVFVQAQTPPSALESQRQELYVVPALGGSPLRLASMPVDRFFQGIMLAAKGARVVYGANQNSRNRVELFSVPSDGSAAPIRLSGPATTNFGLSLLQISPDGRRALYLTDKETSSVQELYSVLVDGSQPPVKLNGPLVANGDVTLGTATRNALEISPDGARVVYAADQDADEKVELFSVPIAGGPALRLNGVLPAQGDVVDFDIAPDSRLAVYVADQDADEVFELFASRLDGSAAPFRVGPSLAPEKDVALRVDDETLLDPLQITPDGRQAIYLADEETEGAIELFRAPLDGTQVTTRMNEILAIGPVEGDVLAFEFTPDGKRIAYVADQDENDVFELYGVRTDGHGGPVKLSGDMVDGGDVWGSYFGVYGPTISADGSRIVYRADQDTDEIDELYSSPMDGSAPPVKLNGALAPLGNVTAFLIDPTSRLVTFRADAVVDERYELFSAPIDGSAPAVRLSGTMVGALQYFEISPDGTRVVYVADQEVEDRYELYSVPIDGSAPPVKLNGTLVAGGASLHEISPDSRWVTFAAAQEAIDRQEVYVVPIDAGTPPLKISGPSLPGTHVSEILFAPDGTRVLWNASSRLFVAPRDGSQPPLQLSTGEFVSGGYGQLEFSTDGLHLVYIASLQGNSGLFSVRVDGTTPRAQLSASGQFVENEYYDPLLVSSAGRAVYLARVGSAHGTFSVPIDGSAAPVRLAAVSAYDSSFLPDGNTLFFIGAKKLFRVPVDGSAPPEVVVNDKNVSEFELGPRGDRVAFQHGNLYAGGVVELFLDLLDDAPTTVARGARLR